MLYSHNKSESIISEGMLAKSAIDTLLNKQLLKKVILMVSSTGNNASFAVWSAASPDAPMLADALVISVSNDVTLKVVDLDSPNEYFLYD